jgi:hypothetical protein
MMRKFIETTSDDHDHGGPGWEYGTCLWSPTLDPRGAKTYNLMLEPQEGDLIIHFYREKSKRYIHGQSFVKKSCYETSDNPPNPSTWSYSDRFYRIDLRDFKKFNNPVLLTDFTDSFDLEIRHEYEDRPDSYPFQVNRFKDPKFKRDSNVGLKQGKYLSECTNQLFNLIKEIEDIQDKEESHTSGKKSREAMKGDYLETRRKIKESTFFARNPKLKKDAIKLRGCRCEACDFKFEEKYGEFGADYIECHHENPLSERPEVDWTDELKTSIDDVKLLCSNCHRMIHHTRPAKDFDFLTSIINKP